jgi:hypothetical protein
MPLPFFLLPIASGDVRDVDTEKTNVQMHVLTRTDLAVPSDVHQHPGLASSLRLLLFDTLPLNLCAQIT